ncbi:hypothetical protein EOL94_00800 [bacterium]|nr:hypothetical protein [bacterium]
MLNKTFVNSLKKTYKTKEDERFKIINISNPVLHDAKRIIFSLHRGGNKKAEKDLNILEKNILDMQKKFGWERLEKEGSYKAAIEEYLEAKLFFNWLNGIKIDKVKTLKLSYSSYLGALSDLCGEIARFCTNEAAKHNLKAVDKSFSDVSKIVSCLTEFDFTGYLRTKYDQARSHLRKIEQINYEVNLRK